VSQPARAHRCVEFDNRGAEGVVARNSCMGTPSPRSRCDIWADSNADNLKATA
jgi:hypothetical protein